MNLPFALTYADNGDTPMKKSPSMKPSRHPAERVLHAPPLTQAVRGLTTEVFHAMAA